MHDLSLGGFVDTDDTSPLHSGSCVDGVYGCHFCWNADNGGRGTEYTCDWCKKRGFTKVLRSIEEPSMCAICDECQVRRIKAAEEAYREMQDAWCDRHCDDDGDW